MNRRNKKKNILMLVVIILFLATLVSLQGRRTVVCQNLVAFGVPLKGMTEEEALEMLTGKIREVESGPLTFRAGSKTCSVSSTDLKLTIDIDPIKDNLRMALGKQSKLLTVLAFQQEGWKDIIGRPRLLSPDLPAVAAKIARELSSEPSVEKYEFLEKDLLLKPAQKGQLVIVEDVLNALEYIQGVNIEVAFRDIDPLIQEKLTPLETIGSFETTFVSENKNRNINLSVAVSSIHGKLINPGETFSFNRVVGERSLARGFKTADVLVGNSYVPGIGGGICQVATTLFNVAIKSGMKIVELHAHSVPAEYVEPGCDATVAWDYYDLKFRNPFDTPVIIGAWTKDGTILMKMFGISDGKEYLLEPIILAEYPAEGMAPGLLVETYYVVKEDDKVIKREHMRKVTYKPCIPR